MLRIKKKLKSWESVLYFESQLYTIFSISIDETGYIKIELLLYIYIYIYIYVY